MLIKIRFPNSDTVLISIVLTRWIINEFEKLAYTICPWVDVDKCLHGASDEHGAS